MKKPKMSKEKREWIAWLKSYGPGKFYDAFVRTAQGAKSQCQYCHQDIFLDIVEGGGVADWKTEDGDYGCDRSPEATAEACGSHLPEKI